MHAPSRSRAREPNAESDPSSRAAAPTTNGFHVKGNVYIGTKTFFETKVDGGLPTLLRAIDDPQLRAFLEQKFLPVAWYDVLPAVPLIRAEARALGLTLKRYLELRTTHQAQQDLSGVYRLILKLASTELVALRLPRLFLQIFDFGSSEAVALAPGVVEGRVLDYPAALHEWFTTSLEIYARTALRLTGAKDVVVSSRRVASKAGDALASIHVTCRWSP